MRLLPILLGFIFTVSLPATQSTFSTFSDVVGTVVPSLFAIPISEIIFLLGVKSIKLAIAAKLMGLMAEWWDTDQREAISQKLHHKTKLNLPYPWLKHGYKIPPVGLPASFVYGVPYAVGNPYVRNTKQFAATEGYFDNYQDSPILYNSGSYDGLQQKQTNENNRDKLLSNYLNLNRRFKNKKDESSVTFKDTPSSSFDSYGQNQKHIFPLDFSNLQFTGHKQGNPQSPGYNQENDQLAGYSQNNFPSYFAGYNQDNSLSNFVGYTQDNPQPNSDRYFQDISQSTFDGDSQGNFLSNFSRYSRENSQLNVSGLDNLQTNSDGNSQGNFLFDGYNQLGQQTIYNQRDSAQSNKKNMDSHTEKKEPSPVYSSSGTRSSRRKRSFNSQMDRIFSIIKEMDNNNCIARMSCEIGLNNRQFEEYGGRVYKFFNDLSLSRMELNGPASFYMLAFEEGMKKNNNTCATMFNTCDLTVSQLSELLRLFPINIRTS